MFSSGSVDNPVSKTIAYTPIGLVETPGGHEASGLSSRSGVSKIVLESALSPGLVGLRPDQEILVVYHCHRSTGFSLRQHPPGGGPPPQARGLRPAESASSQSHWDQALEGAGDCGRRGDRVGPRCPS
jgi:hypothetical protein